MHSSTRSVTTNGGKTVDFPCEPDEWFGPLSDMALRGLCMLFAMITALLLLTLLTHADRIWPILFWPYVRFSIQAFVMGLVILVFCFAFAKRLAPWRFNIGFALLAGWLYWSVPSAPLGNLDGLLQGAARMDVSLAEPLGNVLVHYLYPYMSPNLLPPICGMLSAFMFLTACDELFGSSRLDRGSAKLVCALGYLGSGSTILFFRDYVDSATAPSVPFLLLFVFLAAKYLQNTSRRFDGYVLLAAVAIILAAMVHGSNLFLLPAFIVVVFLRRLSQGQVRLLVAECISGLGLMTFLCGATLLVLTLMGFRLQEGTTGGGADQCRFVPLQELPSWHFHFTMLSWDHAIQTANIALTVSPVAVLVVAVGLRKILTQSLAQRAEYLLLAVMAMAYICFASLWGFDLGFPADTYLMFGISLPMQLFVIALLLLLSRPWQVGLLTLGIVYSWVTLFLMLE